MRNSIKRYAKLFLVLTLLYGCRRDELPVKPHEAGDVTTATVDMDPLYKYQVYFSLRTNSEVGRNEKTVWDLGFESSADGYHVVLNGAASMFAMSVANATFEQVSIADTVGFAFNRKWDSFTGSLDSTAMGDWRSAKPVYIIDRGFDEKGRARGWSKVQVLSVSSTSYRMRVAKPDGTDERIIEIAKDSTYNLSFLSLSSGLRVTVEPPRDAWDIALSQYTYVFYDMDPPVPYLVTGCVLNRFGTSAYEDTTTSFESTTIATVKPDQLSSDITSIGYDWKYFDGSKYTVRANNYIIRDSRGLLYKFHFTGFYNAAGIKGNPQWEFQRL
jgi:hypothetical protein